MTDPEWDYYGAEIWKCTEIRKIVTELDYLVGKRKQDVYSVIMKDIILK